MSPLQTQAAYRPRSQTEADFSADLYEEHLEEASWLYDLHCSLPHEPGADWLDLEAFENRYQQHLQALMLGGDMALEVCRHKALSGDYGELHAALRIFCRTKRAELMWEALEAADAGDEDVSRAVCDALVAELPKTWEGELIKTCCTPDSPWQSLAFRFIGHRRLGANGRRLTETLDKRQSEALEDLIWALGRLRYVNARLPLLAVLQDQSLADEHRVLEAAALALMRLGESRTVSLCLDHARFHVWPCLVSGLGGSRAVVPALWQLVSSDKATPEVVLALALIGDASVIDTLVAQLDREPLSEAAATGLYLITGAELMEDVFVPEEIDEDELFDEEKENKKQGESPPPKDPPAGETQRRLSRNSEIWRAWTKEHGAAFERGIRYRLGKPYEPSVLFHQLQAPTTPALLRNLAAEELAIRYRHDCRLSTDMFVVTQRHALQETQTWVEEQAGSFPPGKWVYNGQES